MKRFLLINLIQPSTNQLYMSDFFSNIFIQCKLFTIYPEISKNKIYMHIALFLSGS